MKLCHTLLCFCQHSLCISDLANLEDKFELCVAIFTICLDETTIDWVHMSWDHSDYKWKKHSFLRKSCSWFDLVVLELQSGGFTNIESIKINRGDWNKSIIRTGTCR